MRRKRTLTGQYTLSKLYAVRPDGTTNWVVALGTTGATPGSVQFSSPVIGPDGTVYLGSLEGKLYAASPAGRTNWVVTLGARTYSSPAIGPDGTLPKSEDGGACQTKTENCNWT